MLTLPVLVCNCIIMLIGTAATDSLDGKARMADLKETLRYRRNVGIPFVRNQDTEEINKLEDEPLPERRQQRNVQNQLFTILKNRKKCWFAVKDYAGCYSGDAKSTALKQDRKMGAAAAAIGQKPKNFWITGRKKSIENRWNQLATVIANNVKRSLPIERWESSKPAMKLIWHNVAQIMNEESPKPFNIWNTTKRRLKRTTKAHNNNNDDDQKWKRYKPFWITGKKSSTSSATINPEQKQAVLVEFIRNILLKNPRHHWKEI